MMLRIALALVRHNHAHAHTHDPKEIAELDSALDSLSNWDREPADVLRLEALFDSIPETNVSEPWKH